MKQKIEKMINKIEPLIDRIQINDEKGEGMLTNIKAYVSDSKHFLKNGNLVKSFESIVWAWAILEICQELEIFRIEK